MVGIGLGVSLVTYGNHWLSTGFLDEDGLDSLVDQHARRLRFLLGGIRPGLLAQSAGEWFALLRDRGCSTLQLALDPRPRDHDMVVEFGIGASPMWALFTSGPEGGDPLHDAVWHVSETSLVTGETDLDLVAVAASQALRPGPSEVDLATNELSSALDEALALATRRGEDHFAMRFQHASAILEQEEDQMDELPFLFPEDFGSLPRRRLLTASAWAYVFGEGGWCEWDYPEETGRAELARVALNLYVGTTRAIEAAVNVG